MKKTKKRLELNRLTLSNLNVSAMQNIQAGAPMTCEGYCSSNDIVYLSYHCKTRDCESNYNTCDDWG
jgi:hypothetical protein